jgi:hypothetical protein
MWVELGRRKKKECQQKGVKGMYNIEQNSVEKK